MSHSLLIFTFIAILSVQSACAADLKVDSGLVYHDYTVSAVNEDSLTITHSSGVARIKFEDLPTDLKKKHFPKGIPTPKPTSQAVSTPTKSNATTLLAFLPLAVLLTVCMLVVRWFRRNAPEQNRGAIWQVKRKAGGGIIMAGSLCAAMYLLFFYDTSVVTERRPAAYYQGTKIVPEIPPTRVHNLGRANFQQNAILVCLAFGIFGGFRMLLASRNE